MSTKMPSLHPLPAGLPGIIPPFPRLLPPLRKLVNQQIHPAPLRPREVRRPHLAAHLEKEVGTHSTLGTGPPSLPGWLISAPTLF